MDDFYPSEKENRKKNFDSSKKFERRKIDAEYKYQKRAQKIKKKKINDQQADEIWKEWENDK